MNKLGHISLEAVHTHTHTHTDNLKKEKENIKDSKSLLN